MRKIAIHTGKTPPLALRYQSTGHVERSEIPHHGIGKRDRETGLDYRLARFYDSDIARFLSGDPLGGEAPEWSPYRSFYDNPLKFVDPTGLFETKYVDEFGNTLADIDDGSEEINVIPKENQDELFLKLIEENVKDGEAVAEINNKLGKKYGVNIKDIDGLVGLFASEIYRAGGSTKGDVWQYGYMHGYEENGVKYPEVFRFSGEGGFGAYFEYGRKRGESDKISGRMSLVNPIPKNNLPKWGDFNLMIQQQKIVLKATR